MDPVTQFRDERAAAIAGYGADAEWRRLSNLWLERAFRRRYMYNFDWMGRPIIQLPTDIVATQELIWSVKPDLIIETGIAHGGSLVLSASILALIELADATAAGTVLDPARPKRKVLGIDIDIRTHNRAAIDAHPLAGRIEMLEGSSIAPDTIAKVRSRAGRAERIMVFLDSNHTHAHVLAELEAYAPLTSKGSYCVVFDTVVEDMPADLFPDRPWSPGDNPKTAIAAYRACLAGEGRVGADGAALHFELDRSTDDKLMISVMPGGTLRRI